MGLFAFVFRNETRVVGAVCPGLVEHDFGLGSVLANGGIELAGIGLVGIQVLYQATFENEVVATAHCAVDEIRVFCNDFASEGAVKRYFSRESQFQIAISTVLPYRIERQLHRETYRWSPVIMPDNTSSG